MSTAHISNETFAFKESADIFSPKSLIELVRPGGGVANDAGDLVLIPSSKYSFQDKETRKGTYVVTLKANAASAEFLALAEGDTFWLDARTVGHVISGKDGQPQQLYAVSLKYADDSVAFASNAPVLVGTFPASGLANFKYSAEGATLVFSADVWPDVNLTTIQAQDTAFENRGTTALVYDQTYVRHWDTWMGPKRSTLFSVGLKKADDGKWLLQDKYIAPLKGTGHHTPVEPFGGTDNFDVSATHIVYTAKDPALPVAWHTRQNVYIVPSQGGEAPRQLTSGKQGATNSPVFNNQGTKAAWTEMDKDGFEADRAKIVVYDLTKDVRFTVTPNWDRSANQLTFAPAGDSLIFTASDSGHVKVFSLQIPPTPSSSDVRLSDIQVPVALTHTHAVSSVQPLSNGRVLFTQSSLTSPNNVFILSGLETPSKPLSVEQITRFSENELQGKQLDEGEQYWFKGAGGILVHGWILKPKGFKKRSNADANAKWPVVFLVHGGPQGAWEDSWSTRWNPNVFAQQGYFVITPNPTGSTSFGQEFTNRISENWGGRPFEDLQKGWKAALKLYPEIDADRAVAAGASWGGYAMNWINGHPEFDFGFKALVCHDGVFDTRYNGFSTEELFFFNHEFGGEPWSKKGKILSEKWNPSNFIDKFSTPHLLFHGSRDYRLPETESLGCFNALQQRGVDSRLVVFPDENHWVLKPENSLKWHDEVFRWFAKYAASD
ncbi:alpha/beta-hydrolase [Gautieria morchelliformis]|nr:alpha/beta-hydrolase [Gautieria morchelliformis]